MQGRILYVEDDMNNMQLIQRMVKLMDFELLMAFDGLSGVSLAQHTHPDLILMDINLPDISGLEATRRIKALRELAHIPIVALTADTENYQQCRDAGCDAYLNKPVHRASLLKVITDFTGASIPA
jgi:two-component system cell cycle response regulator DivK